MIQSHTKNIFETLGRNPVHPFPARMSPGIALAALKKKYKMRVLDPMMGSGTVLAVARHFGHTAVGVDLDPLAVLLSRVWTTPLNVEAVQSRGALVLERAIGISRTMPASLAYPREADEATKKFVRYWFDLRARRQLASLSRVISRVHDPVEQDALWCAFSRLIITKKSGASLAMDLSHSRPHKMFEVAPVMPFTKFLEAVRIVSTNTPVKGAKGIGPATRTILGDARHLSVRSGSVDLVLTSPPYLNAIDYMRCSKFSLVWMGFKTEILRGLRGASIGSEISLPKDQLSELVTQVVKKMKLEKALGSRDLAIFGRYVRDIDAAVGEVARVLAPQGKAIYVVGNSSVKGTFVENSAVVEAVACRHGLRLLRKQSRDLPPNRRYLPAPTFKSSGDAMKARMRQEVVMSFGPEVYSVAAN